MKIIPVVEDFAGIAVAMKDPGLPEGTGVEAAPVVSAVDDYPGIAAALRGLEVERAASWRRFTEPAEELCEDEGCDHHGAPHICTSIPAEPRYIEVTVQLTPASAAESIRAATQSNTENMIGNHKHASLTGRLTGSSPALAAPYQPGPHDTTPLSAGFYADTATEIYALQSRAAEKRRNLALSYGMGAEAFRRMYPSDYSGVEARALAHAGTETIRSKLRLSEDWWTSCPAAPVTLSPRGGTMGEVFALLRRSILGLNKIEYCEDTTFSGIVTIKTFGYSVSPAIRDAVNVIRPAGCLFIFDERP